MSGSAQASQRVLVTGGAVTGSVCDITDSGAVDAMFGDLHAASAGLDVLVNNAGVGGPTTPVEEYPRETWAAVLAVGGRRRTPRSA